MFSKEGTGLNRRSRGGNICVYMFVLCLCVFEGRDRVCSGGVEGENICIYVCVCVFGHGRSPRK